MHDVGLLQKDDGACQYFINVAGCAFQGFVAERIEVKNKKLKLGKAGFLLGIADALFRYQSFPVSVNSDDRQMENTVFNLSCGICRYAGGGMKLTPAAIPDDGLLDITIAQDFTRLEVVQKIFGLYNGTFVRHKKVIQWRCGSLAVSSSQPLAIETDGEFFGYGNFKISIIPSSIQMIVSK
jgi:diacylglycerol kinase family enzyme